MIAMSMFVFVICADLPVCFFLQDWLSVNEEMDTAEKINLFCFLFKGFKFIPFFTHLVFSMTENIN